MKFTGDKIEIDLRELFAFVQKFPSKVVDRAVMLTVIELTRQMKIEAPKKTRTLSRSIGVPRKVQDLVYAIIIGASHWRPVQFGSVPHVIEAKNVSVLSFEWHGEQVFFKRVQHPGTKANPFITRAVTTTMGRVAEFVNQAKNEIV